MSFLGSLSCGSGVRELSRSRTVDRDDRVRRASYRARLPRDLADVVPSRRPRASRPCSRGLRPPHGGRPPTARGRRARERRGGCTCGSSSTRARRDARPSSPPSAGLGSTAPPACGTAAASRRVHRRERARGDRHQRAARTHERVDDNFGQVVSPGLCCGALPAPRRAMLESIRLTGRTSGVYTVCVADLESRLVEVLAPRDVLVGDEIADDYTHDEALTSEPVAPLAVVRPGSTADVAAVLRIAASWLCRSRRAAPGLACRARACHAPTASCSRSSA